MTLGEGAMDSDGGEELDGGVVAMKANLNFSIQIRNFE